MNHFTRIALAAGFLSATALPAFAQNGTPLTGITSPTPSDHPAAAVTHANKTAKVTAPATKKPGTRTSMRAAPAKTMPPHG